MLEVKRDDFDENLEDIMNRHKWNFKQNRKRL